MLTKETMAGPIGKNSTISEQFWSDIKKVGGVATGALLIVIAGGKLRKK